MWTKKGFPMGFDTLPSSCGDWLKTRDADWCFFFGQGVSHRFKLTRFFFNIKASNPNFFWLFPSQTCQWKFLFGVKLTKLLVNELFNPFFGQKKHKQCSLRVLKPLKSDMLVSPLLDILRVQKPTSFSALKSRSHLTWWRWSPQSWKRRLGFSDSLLPFQREKGGVLHGSSIYIHI